MDDEALYDAYIKMYWQTIKNIDDLIAVPMKQDGLSFEQFLVMRDLLDGDALSVTEIARMRGVTTAAVSRQLKSLLQRRLLTQVQDPNDRRKQYLHLTPLGKEIATRLSPVVSDRFFGWVETIGRDDANEFLRLMQKIGDSLIEKKK